MTCEEFRKILPELGSGNSLERIAHLRSCSQCAGLLVDLNEIARQAKQLQASDEPSPRVWQSIAASLMASAGAVVHSLDDELHTNSCPTCAQAIADLETLAGHARVLRALDLKLAEPGTAAAAVPGLAQTLTPRERQVLGLLAVGQANRDIADELVISLDTVKRHVSHILAKLAAANRTEAVARARDLNLIP